ncbi:hypothetical protein Gpo141_00004603 [Globisporangium polare]
MRMDLSTPRDGDLEAKPTAGNASPKSQRPASARSIASICNSIRIEAQRPPAPMDAVEKAKLRSFLESWQDEELSFRSSILFSETTFAQAKDWPKPNAFLAAIAYGCLEQFGFFLEKEYPLLIDIITELGSAVYSNFGELLELQQLHQQQQQQYQETSQSPSPPPLSIPGRNRFLFYFQHGQHWFQDVAEQKHHTETLKFTAASSKDEIQRLNDKLHTQQAAQTHELLQLNKSLPSESRHGESKASPSSFSAFSDPYNCAGFQFPQLRNILYSDNGSTDRHSQGMIGRLDLQPSDYDFWPCCEEILLVFQSLPPKEALKVLSTLLEKSAELSIPMLGEAYAVAVDLLDEKERRRFLREYFLLVSSSELQDALHQRDECNDEKRWQLFIDELKERLGLGLSDSEDSNEAVDFSSKLSGSCIGSAQQQPGTTTRRKRLERFHSDEAKVGAKVHEMMELLEDLAAEASFLDEKQSGLSSELLKKLREYEDPDKRAEKGRELTMKASLKRSPFNLPQGDSKQCACHCGKHRLVHQDDELQQQPVVDPVDQDDSEDERKKASLRPRKSTMKRPLSAKRKNAVSFGNRLSRGSTTQLRLFPLAEVCHMLSAILHLKFSRDVTEAASIGGGSGRSDPTSLIMEDRWSFLRRTTKPVTFKTLAKDFLTRKYGIKSIAVMHTLQLERSLMFYSAMDKHVRCELFAWFFGADKLRLQSKDYAFQFFQKLVKSLMSLFTSTKKPTGLNSSIISSIGGGRSGGDATAQQLSFATLISVWTEFIGDGESANSGTLVRYLAPSHAVDACSSSFPVRIKESSEYASLLERLYRLGLEKDQVELEAFFKRAMEVWQVVFDRFVSEVESTLGIGGSDAFNFDAFTACVARNDMELTGGERLEIFDLLTSDDDESAVSRKKMVAFFLEAKYLRAND